MKAAPPSREKPLTYKFQTRSSAFSHRKVIFGKRKIARKASKRKAIKFDRTADNFALHYSGLLPAHSRLML